MNKNKKNLSILAVFAMAVVALFGTVAYFSDSDKVENKFTVGSIDISIDEPNFEDKHMTPGKELDKDPAVTVNAESEASYVFMAIDNHLTNILEDIEIDENWTEVEEVSKEGNRSLTVYVYTGDDTEAKIVEMAEEDQTLPALFKSVKVKDALDHDDFEGFEDLSNHLDIAGFAHQAYINGEASAEIASEAAVEFFQDLFQ